MGVDTDFIFNIFAFFLKKNRIKLYSFKSNIVNNVFFIYVTFFKNRLILKSKLNKNNKILFTLKSFLFKYLHKDLNKLLLFTYKINMLFYKYTTIFMPVKIKKFSVVRSPTMSKLSKEQF